MNRKKNEGPLAAALKYDGKKDLAPRVTAKGRGLVAERIIELAREHDIPIKNDPGLIQILLRLDLDEQIPESLYKVVAEILAFVYSLDRQYDTR